MPRISHPLERSRKPEFLRVGVTGGIGAGKSTLCRLFAHLGRTIIEADEVARRIVEEDAAVRAGIQRAFGPDAYAPSGRLNRHRMAAVVFSDSRKRRTLNSIVHPAVFRAIEHEIRRLPPDRIAPYLIIEAALIFETGMDRRLDYVIVVTADPETCINRVAARDGVGVENVLLRMKAQMPLEQKVRMADLVVRNVGSKEDLVPAVNFLDNLLTSLGDRRAHDIQ